jgi:hypothetical protein
MYSNRRGETVIAGFSCHLLGYIFNRIFTELKDLRGVRYFGVVWTQTFGTFSHPLNIAWMSLACDDSEVRALAMAMYVPFLPLTQPSFRHAWPPTDTYPSRVIMGANIAGIYGAQIFRQEDRPFYRTGFTINCAVLAVGLSLAIVRYVDDVFRRRRNRNQLEAAEPASDDGSQAAKFEGDVKETSLAR